MPTEKTMTGNSDMVSHPDHYSTNDYECIDEMVIVFGYKKTFSFCVLNAWKYRYRFATKGGKDDLEKANRYVEYANRLRRLYGYDWVSSKLSDDDASEFHKEY